jgi:hypothetical protein
MKRVVASLILISYVLLACGNALEAGCCRDEGAHAAGEHAEHAHAHSKVLVAAHLLLHQSVSDNATRIVASHCCCVKQGEQEPGLQPHSLNPQFPKPRISDLSSKVIPCEGFGVLSGGSSPGAPLMLDSFGAELILRSIRSTILLI